MVKPYRKSRSIKAPERKLRHQDEHVFKEPTFPNVFTKFSVRATESANRFCRLVLPSAEITTGITIFSGNYFILNSVYKPN